MENGVSIAWQNIIDDAKVSAENLMCFLDEDADFVGFFNAFLSLPTFAPRLFYNTATQRFEEFEQKLAGNDAHEIKSTSASLLYLSKSKTGQDDHIARIGYYVKFLSKEDGLRWIIENRLESFLKSNFYAEFKLSRCIAVAETNYLEILLHDAVISDQKLLRSPCLRSNRRLTLFPGLKLFREEQELASQLDGEPDKRSEETPVKSDKDNPSAYISSQQSVGNIKEDSPNHECAIPGSLSSLGSWERISDKPSFEQEIKGKHGEVYSWNETEKPFVSRGDAFCKQPEKEVNESNLSMGKTGDQINISSYHQAKLKKNEWCSSVSTDSESDCEESVPHPGQNVMKVEDRKSLDLGSKAGFDVFKEFLVDTSGEKLIAFWIDIERWKSLTDNEKVRCVPKLRKTYLAAGSQFELAEPFKFDFQVALSSLATLKNLVHCQDKVLGPLLSYWCARFLLHNKFSLKSTSGYSSADHHCIPNQCSFHSNEARNLPQRPISCIPHMKITVKSTNEADQIRKGTSTIQESIIKPCIEEKSRTLKKMRGNSAHPRITSAPKLRNTNVGEQQLLILTAPAENDFGFRAPGRYRYHNEAAEIDYRRNIRLYIEPTPPQDSNFSVVKRVEGTKTLANEATESRNGEQTLSHLAEVLLLEKHGGEHFLKYIQRSENKLWLNCYLFWRELRDYTECFFTDTFLHSVVQQKASTLYSTYIVRGSAYDVNCDSLIQDNIYKALYPPYEDLFDDAEEHILNILVEPWTQMLQDETAAFDKLNREEQLKFIEVVRKKKSLPFYGNESEEEESVEEDERDRISIEDASTLIQMPKDGITFDRILKDRDEKSRFQDFLQRKDKKANADLLAWMDIESFRRMPSKVPAEIRDKKAIAITEKWLGSSYFFGSNSPATKAAQEEVKKLCKDTNYRIPERPPSPAIFEVQRYIRARLERRWLPMFKETSEFINKRKSRTSVTEMVEDIMMKRRLQRSEAAWKILNSRWISGSRDVVSLRQTLLDPTKCNQFRTFVSLKGDLLENSVNFWLEIQKFKDLCHCHLDNFAVSRKIGAIIEVFIKSSIPPELQIDVPIEIAERLYEKAAGRTPQHGPYLFREAQTTVFRILFSYWKDYVAFTGTVASEDLSQRLEDLRKTFDVQKKAKKMIQDRKRLAKMSVENKRKERDENARGKQRAPSEFTSLKSLEDEDEMETRAFSYSKHLADKELKDLEQRMRDNGLSVEELTEIDVIQNHHGTDKSIKESTCPSEDRVSHRSASVASASRARRKALVLKKGMEREKGKAHGRKNPINDAQQSENLQKNEKVTNGKDTLHVIKKDKSNSSRGRPPRKLSQVSRKSDRSKSNAKDVYDTMYSLMPGTRQKPSSGETLTVESLRRFDKISEEQASGSPLPLIRISKFRDQQDQPTKTSTSHAKSSLADKKLSTVRERYGKPTQLLRSGSRLSPDCKDLRRSSVIVS